MLTESPLRKTPLYAQHLQLKAKLTEFGGWSMPLQYEGILAEHIHTRRAVSLFDTCHMGEFFIEGDVSACGLNQIVTQRIADMPLKSCRYGMMLNPQGGILDDLIVYRMDTHQWMIVVNASQIEKKADHFKTHLSAAAMFQNVSQETAKLDLQGPLSRQILSALVPGVEKLTYFTFEEFNLLHEQCIISRTGYTGELGFEIYYPADKVSRLWNKLLSFDGVKPAGLGARDVLRLEMGYSLYGQDMDATLTPLQSGLSVFVDFEKDFIGKGALLQMKESGIPQKAVAFVSKNRRAPRHHQKIFRADRQEIGFVTSGTFSPCLELGIGLGLIREPEALSAGDPLFFGQEETLNEAVAAARPFYKAGTLKN